MIDSRDVAPVPSREKDESHDLTTYIIHEDEKHASKEDKHVNIGTRVCPLGIVSAKGL